jgi:Kef-type K+ transport system membrane component KefB
MHPKTPDEIVAVVLLDVAVIVLAARGMGILARRVGQPAVVGEIVAGLVLGPSVLGQFPGNPSLGLFPIVVRPYLNVVAQVGLVIFMFIVGLELDLTLVRGRERVASVISISSVALPFALGIGLAALIYTDHQHVAGKVVSFWPFALFIGVSMSITAFPVLARMLTERGMQRVEIGAIALACASIDDVLAWSILAVVVAVASSTSAAHAPELVGEAVAFVLVMFLVVRPLLKYLAAAYHRAGRLTPNIFAIVIAGFLASAFVTGWIGLHVIFGAFLFGVVMTREGTATMFREILERLEQVSLLLLLPVFFVITGLKANVTHLGPNGGLVLLGVLFVAIVGKFAGASVAARAQGLSGRKSRALGVLMNNRGLTELVILSVGVSLKVLDQSLFTILVLMAVITTIMTGPLLRLVYPRDVLEREVIEAERATLGMTDAFRVVVAVDVPETSRGMVEAGAALTADERPAELVLSRFIESGRPLEVASGLTLDLAQVASGLVEMQSLASDLEERGVPVEVRSHPTGDLVQSLLTQSEAIGAAVLLVPADLESPASAIAAGDRLAKAPSTTVALWSDPGGTGIHHGQSVEVWPGPGGDGDAALELAVRVVDAVGGELLLTSPDRRRARHLEHLAGDLASAGLVVQVRPGEGGPTSVPRVQSRVLTVVPVSSLAPRSSDVRSTARDLGELTGGPVLLVRAGRGTSDDALNRLLDRLRARETGAAGDTRTYQTPPEPSPPSISSAPLSSSEGQP